MSSPHTPEPVGEVEFIEGMAFIKIYDGHDVDDGQLLYTAAAPEPLTDERAAPDAVIEALAEAQGYVRLIAHGTSPGRSANHLRKAMDLCQRIDRLLGIREVGAALLSREVK